MKRVLVTGSNRGLGLEWVRQYAREGARVYATCRFPEQAEALRAVAREHEGVSLHRLDVTRPDEVADVAEEFSGAPLDLLVNNAGIYREQWGRDRLGSIDYGDWLETYAVNTLGAMRVSEALIGHLARGENPLIVAVSSHMGSIAEIGAPNDYAYRSSKAALNAAMKGLSLEVAGRGVGVLLLHPGWACTRMGGEGAPIPVEVSVTGMRERVEEFSLERSGRFFNYDGREIPW